jgi:hypothetical protein
MMTRAAILDAAAILRSLDALRYGMGARERSGVGKVIAHTSVEKKQQSGDCQAENPISEERAPSSQAASG